MIQESNPKAAQVRIEPCDARRCGGLRKHELRIGPQPSYVDGARTCLNRTLIAPRPTAEMKARAMALRDRQPRKRAMKSNAAISFSGVITFGHEARALFDQLTSERQDAAFRDLAARIADHLNAELTGLVVHLDEQSIHAHFQMDAYDRVGQALSDKVKRATLRKLQDITFEVMSRAAPGIERGRSKVERLKAGAKPEDVVHKSPREMRERLPRELDALKKEIAALTEQIAAEQEKLAKNERLAEEAHQKAEKLGQAGAEADKLRGKAEAYERRAEAAQTRINAKQAEIEALEARQVALAAAPVPDAPVIPIPPRMFSPFGDGAEGWAKEQNKKISVEWRRAQEIIRAKERALVAKEKHTEVSFAEAQRQRSAAEALKIGLELRANAAQAKEAEQRRKESDLCRREAAVSNAEAQIAEVRNATPIYVADLPPDLIERAWENALPHWKEGRFLDGEGWCLVDTDARERKGEGALAYLAALMGNGLKAVRLLCEWFDPARFVATINRLPFPGSRRAPTPDRGPSMGM